MGWNYRILAKICSNDEVSFGVYSVYYDENGKPDGYSANPVEMSAEDIEYIRFDLDKMKEALDKPVLWEGERFPEEYKENYGK